MKKIIVVSVLVILVLVGAYVCYNVIKKPVQVVKEAEKEVVVEKLVKEPIINELIFTSNKDGPPKIYTTDSEGKNQISLSSDPESIWDGLPTYSAKGQRVAFLSDRVSMKGIYILEGGKIIRLIEGGYDPAFSPNGEMIAFSVQGPRGDYEIYIIKDLDKVISEIKKGVKPEIDLINVSDHSADDWAPAWLSNERIVFTSMRDGNAEIYAVNIDKTNPINLTNHPAWDGLPSCSRNGKIVFQSYRSGNFDIWQMGKDGKSLINLTNHPAEDTWPAISGEGNKIAFASNRGDGGKKNLWVIEGEKVIRVTDHPVDDWAPRWTY